MESLLNHFRRYVDLKKEDEEEILSFFKKLIVEKKGNLLEEGQLCRATYFVQEGCLRMYFINDKGIEQTTQFALEHWWITDQMAFQNQQPSTFYIQAVEKSELFSLDFQAQEKLLEQFPYMEKYFRKLQEIAHGASQRRIRYLYTYSKEEYYHHFNDHYPGFVQRIPQYLLASFLGFTPEYLSEIRKKNRS